MARLVLAMEELEVEKLEQAEELARKTSSSAVLALNVKNSSIAQTPDETADDTTSAQSQPSQDVSKQDVDSTQSQQIQTPEKITDDDTAGQNDKKPQSTETQKSEDEEIVQTPEETKVTSEAYVLKKEDIALEYYTDDELGDKSAKFGEWLGMLGITYGVSILKHIGSAVLFTAVHLIKFLFTSLSDLKNYINRRFDSYEDLQHQVAALHNSMADIKKDKADGQFSDTKTIDHLKIGTSVDINANIKNYSKFMSEVMSAMVKSALEDFTQTKSIVSQDLGNFNTKPSNIIKLRQLGSIVKPGTLEGYTDLPENLQSLISSETLPGDVKLLLAVPITDIADDEAYIKAYQHSYASLVGDTASYKQIHNLNYMTKNELKAYLLSMNEMLLACIEHKKLFEQLMAVKMSLRYSFKAYMNQIVHSSNKLDVQNSFIELIYVKTIFAEKVYIQASMDMHDYSVKVLKASIKFAQVNLRALQ
jgi:hypothetical protein